MCTSFFCVGSGARCAFGRFHGHDHLANNCRGLPFGNVGASRHDGCAEGGSGAPYGRRALCPLPPCDGEVPDQQWRFQSVRLYTIRLTLYKLLHVIAFQLYGILPATV